MTRSRLVSVLALVLAVAGATAARAQCIPGCAAQKKSCVQVARMDMLQCKSVCRANPASAALGTCMRGCMSTFLGARGGCSTGFASCRDACPPPSAPASCQGVCGRALGTCAQAVAAQAKTCVTSCRTAPDKPTCLGACGTAARSGAAACAAAFSGCTSACPGGSPSAAFID
jgi:hypothetical protein